MYRLTTRLAKAITILDQGCTFINHRVEPFSLRRLNQNGCIGRTKASWPSRLIRLASAAPIALGSAITMAPQTRYHYLSCEPMPRYTPHGGVRAAVLRLQEVGITLVAIDFDMTLVTTHTAGRWELEAKDLVPLVRPELKALIVALLVETEGIEVAIVSFSPQVELIKDVLELSFGTDIASRIRVRGGPPFFFAKHGWYGLGKQSHIASLGVAQKDIEKVLLIDDGLLNIFVGVQHGLRGIWLDTNDPTIIEDISGLE